MHHDTALITSMNHRFAHRRLAMLALPEVQMLDVTGPLEVFSVATRVLKMQGARGQGYAIELLAHEPGPVRTSSGIELNAHRAWREVGMTPGQFVERARAQQARRQLEETQQTVEKIAAQCGFGSAETLRRVFLRTLQVTPSEYRHRFQTAKASAG